jgi:hypothetical protein
MDLVLDSMRSCLGSIGVGVLVVYLLSNPGLVLTLIAGFIFAALLFSRDKGDE